LRIRDARYRRGACESRSCQDVHERDLFVSRGGTVMSRERTPSGTMVRTLNSGRRYEPRRVSAVESGRHLFVAGVSFRNQEPSKYQQHRHVSETRQRLTRRSGVGVIRQDIERCTSAGPSGRPRNILKLHCGNAGDSVQCRHRIAGAMGGTCRRSVPMHYTSEGKSVFQASKRVHEPQTLPD